MNINNFIKFAETNFKTTPSPNDPPQGLKNALSRLSGDNLFLKAYSNFKDQSMQHPIFKTPYHRLKSQRPPQSKFSIINSPYPLHSVITENGLQYQNIPAELRRFSKEQWVPKVLTPDNRLDYFIKNTPIGKNVASDIPSNLIPGWNGSLDGEDTYLMDEARDIAKPYLNNKLYISDYLSQDPKNYYKYRHASNLFNHYYPGRDKAYTMLDYATIYPLLFASRAYTTKKESDLIKAMERFGPAFLHSIPMYKDYLEYSAAPEHHSRTRNAERLENIMHSGIDVDGL